ATPMLVPKFLASHRSGHIPVELGPGAPLSFPPPCPSRSTPAGRSFFRGSTISENKSVTHVLGQGGRTPARSVGSIPLPLPLGGRRLANTCESERSRAAAQLVVTNPTLSHVRTNVLDIANSRRPFVSVHFHAFPRFPSIVLQSLRRLGTKDGATFERRPPRQAG